MTNQTNQRLLAALELGLVLLGCSVPISVGLDDGQANGAVAALEKGGVHATKAADPGNEGHWQLLVARDDASAAVSLLAAEALPGKNSPGVLDALGGDQLVPSRALEHARWLAGTAGDLERSLKTLDAVVSVRVHLAVPQKSPLGLETEQPPASASVLMRHRGANLPIAEQDVKRLVSGAVPGLSPDAVSVIGHLAPGAEKLPERTLAQLGPVVVTRTSLPIAKWIIGGALFSNLLLLSLLAWLWHRDRRTRGRLSELEEQAASES